MPSPLRKAMPAMQDPTSIPPRATMFPGSRTATGSQFEISVSPSSAIASQSG